MSARERSYDGQERDRSDGEERRNGDRRGRRARAGAGGRGGKKSHSGADALTDRGVAKGGCRSGSGARGTRAIGGRCSRWPRVARRTLSAPRKQHVSCASPTALRSNLVTSPHRGARRRRRFHPCRPCVLTAPIPSRSSSRCLAMTVSSVTSPASTPDALQPASSSSDYPARLTDVGILHMAVYIPRTAVAQADLETYDRAPRGKYTIGLGQLYMSFVSDREDVISLALTAVSQLVRDAAIEYPTVRGQQTVDTFVGAMDECYRRYASRAKASDKPPFSIRRDVDYCVFHAPFNKMVQKSFARLVYNDFLNAAEGEDSFFEPVEKYRNLPKKVSHRSREAQRAFVKLSKDYYDSKCAPAAWLARKIGNCYTASLYSSLAALIVEKGNELIGKRVLLYSFGSGFASSMFSLRVTAPVDKLFLGRDLKERLEDRIVAEAEDYIRTLKERESNYGRFGYVPQANIEDLFPGTWYLRGVQPEGERSYDQIPFR
ncbi:Hydroxymethylglutaryl-coenzyme A synthase [Gracilaria domingensis]|nr:Hydroxymethylglutaryl-coenzyme A synthase [Gracilaria domingensis]